MVDYWLYVRFWIFTMTIGSPKWYCVKFKINNNYRWVLHDMGEFDCYLD